MNQVWMQPALSAEARWMEFLAHATVVMGALWPCSSTSSRGYVMRIHYLFCPFCLPLPVLPSCPTSLLFQNCGPSEPMPIPAMYHCYHCKVWCTPHPALIQGVLTVKSYVSLSPSMNHILLVYAKKTRRKAEV